MDIEKNSNEIVRVERTNHKGKDYVSVRIYAKTFDERDFVPTKKGITVSPEVANEVCRALQGLV